jgi:hypothetical protein
MNTSIYPSKVDLWIIILITADLTLLFGLGIYNFGNGASGAILLACGVFSALLMVIFLVPLHYTITPESLEIRHGIIKEIVKLEEIIEVKPTSDPTSAPALSLQRVEIVLKDKSKLISPKNRDQFIQEIQTKIKMIKRPV